MQTNPSLSRHPNASMQWAQARADACSGVLPLQVLKDARGIAFLTVIKGGFVASITLGSGIVIAKLPNGQWCARAQTHTH